MKSLSKYLLGPVLLAVAGIATAAPSAVAQREISGLMAALEGSQCRFQRNGTWYGEADARAHLQRKYDYLVKRKLADTAEQFIDRAGSRSSMSGKPYRISCPGQSEVNAADWFTQRLHALRTAAH